MVDHGRADVYAAELAAFEGTTYEQVVPFDQLVTLARNVCAARWWPLGHIDVVTTRSDALTSSARQCGDQVPVVRLARPQMTRATLVHELAHVLAGVGSGHGPLFRRAYVDLAAAALGVDPAAWLLEQFGRHGLDTAARTWPPPDVLGGAIAL